MTQDETAAHLEVLRPIRSPRGFLIVPVHYSHDPDKDEKWRRKERSKYQDDTSWNREMELDFGSVAGAPAYSAFKRDVHLMKGLRLLRDVPICLCVDFNVEPMVWEIAQIWRDKCYFLDEIRLSPGSTATAVQEFRRRYPAHPAGIKVYGDSTGNARNTVTATSDYDSMRLNFRNYPTEVTFLIPPKNPPVKDRLNAFNAKLLSQQGEPGIKVDPLMCPELVKDLAEVILEPGGGAIYKVRKRDDPYFERTHASDAAGYLIAHEWPVLIEVFKQSAKMPRGPRKRPSRVLGGLR
jgi:hypothetical protein